MDLGLRDRVCVVTGSTGGIGRECARMLADEGARVVTCGRRGPPGIGEALHVTADLALRDGPEHVVSEAARALGAVEVLVNNAGLAEGAPVVRTSLDAWRRHLEVNATGAFLCTRAVLGGMIERGDGRIVTVASTAGLRGARYTAAYTAAKHAAVGLMRAVAAEVAGTGVTANAVCPTYVRTEMTSRSIARIVAATNRSEEEAETALATSSPLGRLLEPDEVAFAVAFLAAAEAAAINGQTLVLDGGGIQT
jgi:NAD(P)-dependent dehydrogenase (short-subunit alcohol dehydrogenase family)